MPRCIQALGQVILLGGDSLRKLLACYLVCANEYLMGIIHTKLRNFRTFADGRLRHKSLIEAGHLLLNIFGWFNAKANILGG